MGGSWTSGTGRTLMVSYNLEYIIFADLPAKKYPRQRNKTALAAKSVRLSRNFYKSSQCQLQIGGRSLRGRRPREANSPSLFFFRASLLGNCPPGRGALRCFVVQGATL